MKILAISGSGRKESTNTALLKTVAKIAGPDHSVSVFSDISELPIFSPDAEENSLPHPVQTFCTLIEESDGLIISSPEYVRAIPGGLKNAIDWLVAREEIIEKPIALMHASHRGEDMLEQLRLVLSTVSNGFTPNIFLRFALMKLSPDEIHQEIITPPNRQKVNDFLRDFTRCIK
ncbi:NADPH-dependent FMN reductase [Kiloniella majae]|uniref:NADPH-dependent FMN reductase n=1 Tax=Kiloniella majae TaxID=1938558 RepID=UPI000A2798FE|nr:NADPH-dependent FMN reductase [Kiloniella majae]